MNICIKKLCVFVVMLTTVAFSSLSSAANSVIDVLVVYTKGTTDLYGSDPSTRFNQIFQVTNQIYKDSGVDLEIRLVKSQLVDYTDDNDAGLALNDITYAKVPAFSGIAALRDQVKADMVIFYRPYRASHGSCGIAWIGGSANGDFSNREWTKYMYAHIAISSCGDYVTAHELGHNMGLKHSRAQDGSGGAFPYALGYGVMNQFTTIMAYQTSFNVDYWTGKLYKFSNPELTCKSLPCGIDRNSPQGADARYALNITGPQIAKFNVGIVGAVSSESKSNASSVSNSASSRASSIASSSSSAAKSSTKSSAKSSLSNAQLEALRTKVTSTKAVYDAAQAAVNTNSSAVALKIAAESTKQSALTKATADAAAATVANAAALKKSTESAAAVKTLQAKVTAALAAYNKSTAATKDANKKIYTDLLASYNAAVTQAATDLAALNKTKSNLSAANQMLTKAKNEYVAAQKATVAEKALTAPLVAKVAPALSAYEAAKKAYDTAVKTTDTIVSFTKVEGVAQYKGADWKNEVRREMGISVERAKEIAAADPNISYFFTTIGYRMILEGSASWTAKGVFYFGDTVFFSGKPWYGSAPGLADAYEKNPQ